MPHPIDVQVGHKVRIARAAKNYSQEKLAHILGVSFQQVQKYEKGTNRISASRNRTISLAKQIDAIPNEDIRNQILNLIKACGSLND